MSIFLSISLPLSHMYILAISSLQTAFFVVLKQCYVPAFSQDKETLRGLYRIPGTIAESGQTSFNWYLGE